MANGNLPFPFPDAVSQFSVESTDLGAQDGGHVGGMVNVVTRSGTNQFHGAAFEFIRNNYIDATNFFSCDSRTRCTRISMAAPLAAPSSATSSLPSRPTSARMADQSQSSHAGHRAHRGEPGRRLVRHRRRARRHAAAIPATQATRPFTLVDPLTGAALPGNKYATPPTYNAPALALQKYLPAINSALDPNNCGFVSYAIPYQLPTTSSSPASTTPSTPKQQPLRPVLHRRLPVPGVLLSQQYPHHHTVRKHRAGADLHPGRGLHHHANVVNSAHISILRRVNNRGYAANDINAATLGVNVYPGGAQRPANDRRQIHHRRRHKLGLPLQRQHLPSTTT